MSGICEMCGKGQIGGSRRVKEMRKKKLAWRLNRHEKTTRVRKYCPHCKETVLFTDSLKRRKNANGKNIYEFAIYKCDRDHTWNKKLSRYKASLKDSHHAKGSVKEEDSPEKPLELSRFRRCGYDMVEIDLQHVRGKWRLDSLLSEYIAGISRAQIKKMIEREHITIDGDRVKAGSFLRTNQTISILLGAPTYQQMEYDEPIDGCRQCAQSGRNNLIAG